MFAANNEENPYVSSSLSELLWCQIAEFQWPFCAEEKNIVCLLEVWWGCWVSGNLEED